MKYSNILLFKSIVFLFFSDSYKEIIINDNFDFQRPREARHHIYSWEKYT
jgi:hypothetical protein